MRLQDADRLSQAGSRLRDHMGSLRGKRMPSKPVIVGSVMFYYAVFGFVTVGNLGLGLPVTVLLSLATLIAVFGFVAGGLLVLMSEDWSASQTYVNSYRGNPPWRADEPVREHQRRQ